jgi:hypothetical protein
VVPAVWGQASYIGAQVLGMKMVEGLRGETERELAASSIGPSLGSAHT